MIKNHFKSKKGNCQTNKKQKHTQNEQSTRGKLQEDYSDDKMVIEKGAKKKWRRV